MSKAVKFTFDTHFDVGPSAERVETRSRKSYSAEEIAVLCEDAREEGRQEASVLATQAVAQSISYVAAAVQETIHFMDVEVERMRAEAAGLALAAAKKLASAAIRSAPEEEIVEALHAAMHQAVGEPRMVVKTAPALAHKIQEKAAGIVVWDGFEGRLQFTGDPSLSGADCRIEWRGGGLERSLAAIDAALTDLIARRFPGFGDAQPVEE